MVTIAHISDFHCSRSPAAGKVGFTPAKLATCIREINKLKPDAVVITGDLTSFGFEEEFLIAKKYIDMIKGYRLIIPGNHDSRYCGYKLYEKYFGFGNNTLELPGIDVIGVDTTAPDIDTGNIGRGKLRWLISEIRKMPKKNCKIVAMHHHILPVPNTGRDRSTIHDAGTVLDELIKAKVNIILCGHKHTPHAWIINKCVVINAGSASAVKLRAGIPNSYNIIKFHNCTVKVLLKEPGKKERLMAEYSAEQMKIRQEI